MNPSVLEVVAAFEAYQREKNAVAAQRVADREAAFAAEMEAREAALAVIVAEFKPVLDRAFSKEQEHYRHPGGVRHYYNTNKGIVLRVRRFDRDGLLRYEVGTGFCDAHEQYLSNDFTTTDVTEFKVNLAKRLGVLLANRASA